MTVTARAPAVAGQFYPADPAVLAATVDRLLDAPPAVAEGPLAAAYVVPHAGYRFSGPTASCAYAHIRTHAASVRRVVLIGPAHHVPVRGCALSWATQWQTPLGAVPLDVSGRSALVDAGLAVVDDHAHAPEHSLEVQLPFLQRALAGPVPVLPIAVGRTVPAAVAAVVTAAVDVAPPGTVVVCSTDLSHYLDEPTAQVRDERTLRAVLDLRPAAIGPLDACGSAALAGLVAWAASNALTPSLLHRSTSADAGAGTDRVVGYAALVLR
jgi:hypothetical protein